MWEVGDSGEDAPVIDNGNIKYEMKKGDFGLWRTIQCTILLQEIIITCTHARQHTHTHTHTHTPVSSSTDWSELSGGLCSVEMDDRGVHMRSPSACVMEGKRLEEPSSHGSLATSTLGFPTLPKTVGELACIGEARDFLRVGCWLVESEPARFREVRLGLFVAPVGRTELEEMVLLVGP